MPLFFSKTSHTCYLYIVWSRWAGKVFGMGIEKHPICESWRISRAPESCSKMDGFPLNSRPEIYNKYCDVLAPSFPGTRHLDFFQRATIYIYVYLVHFSAYINNHNLNDSSDLQWIYSMRIYIIIPWSPPTFGKGKESNPLPSGLTFSFTLETQRLYWKNPSEIGSRK